MTVAEDIWTKVLKRSSAPMRVLAPSMRLFLAALDNPHARTLSGQETIEPCNDASALRLEASVIEHVSSGNISKMNGAEWLKLIFSAIRLFNEAGKVLRPTRRPLVSPPEPSPFGPAFGTQYEKVEIWRKALYDWILKSDEQASAEDWLGAICLSAVIHGMLLDSIRLKIFIAQLAKRTPPSFSSGIAYVLFSLPFRGLGNHHCIRWDLDPVTEMLVWRYLRLSFAEVDTPAHTVVSKFLASNGCRKGKRAQSLGALVNASTAWWLTKADPVDVYIAGRQITCHSIQNRSFARLFKSEVISDATILNPDVQPTLGERHRTLESDSFQLDDVILLFPWMADAQSALELQSAESVSIEVAGLLQTFTADGLAQVYLGWLSFMVRGKSSTGKALELSTIRRRFLAATPRLLSLLGESDPSKLEISTLEDFYGELLTDPDPSIPVLDTGNGLRDFHFYLHETFGIPLLSNEAEVLGEKIALRPVDANLMSADDYEAAMALIDSDIEILGDQDRDACKIVLMFAFKGGARRMEIFGLRLEDVQTILGINVFIRPHSARGLKTASSQRRLPMHAFLNSRDRRLLTRVHHQRVQQCQSNDPASEGTAFLFPPFGTDQKQAWVDKIVNHVVKAIRKATRDPLLFIHHLRHSFATWTYIFLRASDLPSLDRYFTNLPFTALGIKRSRRLRLLLFGRNPQGTRSFAHAVARLLGHSGPRMSFGHYVHSSDFVQAGLAFRLCETIAPEVVRFCSGLQRSTAFEHIGVSLIALLRSSRNQFAPAELLRPPVPKSGRKPGRPKKVDPHLENTWITSRKILDILDLSIGHQLDATQIAKRVALTKDEVEAALKSAGLWGPSIGLEIDSTGNLLSPPPLLRGDPVRNFCGSLEASVAALFRRQPVLCDDGLRVYLEHYSGDKHDVIFRGEKDAEPAKLFLKWMGAIGAPSADYSWLIRTYQAEGLPAWVSDLPSGWRPQNRRRINPRSKAFAASYAKWVGIFPEDENGQTLGKWAAITIFLLRLSIDVHQFRITAQSIS